MEEPFGEVQKWGFYMPESWGSVTIGAPVITKSGSIFIGALDGLARPRHRPQDGQGPVEGAGRCAGRRDAGDYKYKGRQYVVFVARRKRDPHAAGGDQVVAFALPQRKG